MKIAIASDHGGYELKEKIIDFIRSLGHEIQDFGCFSSESCDYPDYIQKAAVEVAENRADRGIVVCGSGVGASIVANKVPGIRAVLCTSEYLAEYSRKHNNSNVIALGERQTSFEEAQKYIKVWLNTPYEGGRHQNRLDKIASLENSLRGKKE